MFYNKNLKQSISLRLSNKDFEFLQHFCNYYEMSLSDGVRFMVSEFRRKYDVEPSVHVYSDENSKWEVIEIDK